MAAGDQIDKAPVDKASLALHADPRSDMRSTSVRYGGVDTHRQPTHGNAPPRNLAGDQGTRRKCTHVLVLSAVIAHSDLYDQKS